MGINFLGRGYEKKSVNRKSRAIANSEIFLGAAWASCVRACTHLVDDQDLFPRLSLIFFSFKYESF